MPRYIEILKWFLDAEVKLSAYTERRAAVKSQQSVIDEVVDTGLRECSPLEAFAVLDHAKSLPSRSLFFLPRFQRAGLFDVVGVLGMDPPGISRFLLHVEPHSCAVNFYQSPQNEFIAVMAYADGGAVKAEKLLVAGGSLGTMVASELSRLAVLSQRHELHPSHPESRAALSFLLPLFGEELLPRLKRIKGIQRLILLPHRLLHLVPLHLMERHSENPVLLDHYVEECTYSPSLA